MKKLCILLPVCLFVLLLLTACSAQSDRSSGFDASRDISVVSREIGSGTRDAFIALFGVDGGSEKQLQEAVIAESTRIMMNNIINDHHAIGYLSLGMLNKAVKALRIDGAAAIWENVRNGSYRIQRPFILAIKGEATGLAKDFIDFILSAEGQKLLSGSYVVIDEDAPAYAGDKPAGHITIAGSTSVAPAMQDLKRSYENINPDANIVIQESDSGAGLAAVMNGACDIGMASRALRDSELAELTEIPIAIDGIAVIVDINNPLTDLTSEQVKEIFTGSITKWSDVQ